MQFGFQMFARGIGVRHDGVTAMASAAERLGFDIVAVSDHIVVPDGIDSRYPYSEDGNWPGAAVGECGEQLTVMAYLAALTTRLKLLSSVMVVPHRQPLLTAKILSTIDVMSAGRLIVGTGAGWMAEEFAALGTPPYAERGKVTDEYIRAFRELWTSEDPNLDGRYASFANIDFAPKPVQKPAPPIWIGGESAPAMRRAIRLGDGWYPASGNPQFRINTPERYREKRDDLRRIGEKEGRDADELTLAFFAIEPVDPTPRKNSEGGRRIFSGAPADVAADVKAFEALGVSTAVLVFQQPELQATLDRLAWFAEEVVPLTRT